MLSTHVQSTSELMSIALCAEHEAIRRYSRLAEDMHDSGNEETASLFERMAEEEREHERLIEEWAKVEGVQLRTDIGPIAWEDPQVPTEYDSAATDPARSTPYRALAFAVHNEERAFRFYTHVAANAVEKTVREYAETLAREELGHAALLRAMRRRAWRKERESGRDEPDIEPAAIHSLPDLLAVATSIEHCLIDNISALSGSYPELRETGATTQRSLTSIEEQLKTAGEPGAGIAAAVESVRNYTRKTAAMRNDTGLLLRRLCSDGDRCFEFYDAVVGCAQDEALMLAAQHLSELALERVGVFRTLLGNSGQQPHPRTA